MPPAPHFAAPAAANATKTENGWTCKLLKAWEHATFGLDQKKIVPNNSFFKEKRSGSTEMTIPEIKYSVINRSPLQIPHVQPIRGLRREGQPAVLLREGRREGGRVRERTLANLTDSPAEKVRRLRRVLRGQPPVGPEEAFATEHSLPHCHVEAVPAMTRRPGPDRLIAPKRSPERDRVSRPAK